MHNEIVSNPYNDPQRECGAETWLKPGYDNGTSTEAFSTDSGRNTFLFPVTYNNQINHFHMQ